MMNIFGKKRSANNGTFDPSKGPLRNEKSDSQATADVTDAESDDDVELGIDVTQSPDSLNLDLSDGNPSPNKKARPNNDGGVDTNTDQDLLPVPNMDPDAEPPSTNQPTDPVLSETTANALLAACGNRKTDALAMAALVAPYLLSNPIVVLRVAFANLACTTTEVKSIAKQVTLLREDVGKLRDEKKEQLQNQRVIIAQGEAAAKQREAAAKERAINHREILAENQAAAKAAEQERAIRHQEVLAATEAAAKTATEAAVEAVAKQAAINHQEILAANQVAAEAAAKQAAINHQEIIAANQVAAEAAAKQAAINHQEILAAMMAKK